MAEATNEQLGITEEERKAYEKKKNIFCGLGDSMIKQNAGQTANIDKVFDSMPEEQKESFSRDVLEKGLILIGVRKKKNDKKKENDLETTYS